MYKRERIIEVKINKEEKNYHFFGIYSPEKKELKKTKAYKKLRKY
jgi:hypothetical protein